MVRITRPMSSFPRLHRSHAQTRGPANAGCRCLSTSRSSTTPGFRNYASEPSRTCPAETTRSRHSTGRSTLKTAPLGWKRRGWRTDCYVPRGSNTSGERVFNFTTYHGSTPTASATPAGSPTTTPTTTATPAAATATPKSTASGTATATASPTTTATQTSTATPTPSLSGTATATPTPTATATPTAAPTETATSTATETPTASA